MRLGWVVQRTPRDQPQQPECPRNHESWPPTPPGKDWQDDERGNRTSDGGATVKDGSGESTLGLRKPFGNHFGSSRPVCGFASPQHKTKACERAESSRKRGRHRREGVTQNTAAQPAPGADTVHHPS